MGVAQHNPVNFHGIRKLSDPLEDIPNEIALDETELQAEKVGLMIVLVSLLDSATGIRIPRMMDLEEGSGMPKRTVGLSILAHCFQSS